MGIVVMIRRTRFVVVMMMRGLTRMRRGIRAIDLNHLFLGVMVVVMAAREDQSDGKADKDQEEFFHVDSPTVWDCLEKPQGRLLSQNNGRNSKLFFHLIFIFSGHHCESVRRPAWRRR